METSALVPRAAQPPAHLSGGTADRSDAARIASRRRWARTIILARMRSPCCIRSRCSPVYAAADPFEGVVTLLEGFLLLALFIPLLQPGLGGIASWPHRHCRQMSGVHGPVCGTGRASVIPRKGLHSCNGRGNPLMRHPLLGIYSERDRHDVMGLYRKRSLCTCCTRRRGG